jgi:hypothetical protein
LTYTVNYSIPSVVQIDIVSVPEPMMLAPVVVGAMLAMRRWWGEPRKSI